MTKKQMEKKQPEKEVVKKKEVVKLKKEIDKPSWLDISVWESLDDEGKQKLVNR